ncbi:MAG: ABC transporter ATP-binding protein [Janthinobacterium lividum]
MADGFSRSPEEPIQTQTLLQVRDLRIAFGKQEAVRGISFDIAAGETLGLVGESGSGKSATSLALMRLLPPDASVQGQVFLANQPKTNGPGDANSTVASRTWWQTFARGSAAHTGDVDRSGVDLLRLPEEAMRQQRGRALAMVFQEPMTALNPVMPVGRQVGEAVLAHAPRTSRRVVRERVLAALQEVGLPDPERRLHDFPHQFSGGQRQRIVIAMALVNRPRLVIADEPTTALDVTVQAQVLQLLKQLRAELGLSMLFISHDLAVVGQIADRIAVMRYGEIVEQGLARDVLTQPQHPYTRALLAAAPTMHTPRDQPLQTGSKT